MSKKIIDIFPPSPTRNLKEKFFSLPYKNKKFWSKDKKIVILSFLFLGLTLSLVHFVFSKVTIEIWPETQTLDFEEEITADLGKKNTDDSVLSKTIPASMIDTGEIIVSQSFPSSGKTSKESKAHGKIKISSSYNLPIKLTANTRFQAPSEENVLYFRSTKAVIVPAKGNLEIDVVADRPGEEYNIEPATFSIPGLVGKPEYTSIFGKSFSRMEGGFKGDVARVEEEDLNRAKSVLTEKLFSEAKEFLKIKASDEYVILDGSSKEEILNTSSSEEAGKEAPSFIFQATVKSQALVFKKSDLENFAKEFIKSKIEDGQKIKEDSLELDYSPESINLNIGKITLKLKFSAKAYSDVNLASLEKLISKKTLAEADNILANQTQIKQVKISFWPPWIKNIPDNDKKIKIQLTID
jgi:hypothetical protein